MSTKQLQLFPDVLDRQHPGQHANYEHEGWAVWGLSPSVRRSRSTGSEQRHVCVVYDASEDKPWQVVVTRHVYTWTEVTKGWGNSKTTKRVLQSRSYDASRRFADRESACNFAERLLSLIGRIRAKQESIDAED